MTPTRSRLPILVLSALLPIAALAAPVCSESPLGGLGGTGAPEAAGGIGGTSEIATGGIGGTGMPADPALGGIGGTSQLAVGGIGGTSKPIAGGIGGTGDAVLPLAEGETGGVVGTITGFASICVNGLEVHYDDQTPVAVDGDPASTSGLAVGQVVAIQVAKGGRGLEATKINVIHAVVGPVSRVDGNELEVLGQRVLLPPGDAAPALGQIVRVSGLRDSQGSVRASRLVLAEDAADFSVVGRVRSGQIGRLRVEGPEIEEGRELMVRGRLDGDRLRVRQVEQSPERAVIERSRAVSLEVRISGREDRHFSGGGHRFDIGDDTQIVGGSRRELEADRVVRASGRIEKNGNIRADRIEIRSRRDDRVQRHGHRGGDANAREDRGGRDDRSGSGRDRAERSDSGSDRPDRIDRSGSGGGGRPERVERPERIGHD